MIEKAERIRGRRSRKADVKGVKVVQHAFPVIVDRAMAFIYDNHVERLRRKRDIVSDRTWFIGITSGFVSRAFVVQILDRFPCQSRIQSLDS